MEMKRAREVAIAVAREAGQFIRSKVDRIQQISYKSSESDLVTDVDQKAEEIIRERLLEVFPEHAILGEEGVEPGAEAAKRALRVAAREEYLWIVDPIDGTTNFIHGIPFFSVSVAFAVRGVVRLGIVYDPMRDECFIAEKGCGASVNGMPIYVSEEQTLAESVVSTGFSGLKKHHCESKKKGVFALTGQVRNMRNLGSAALELAYVAAGRMSGYWEIDLNAWDVAAGGLLVREAGGRVSDTLGEPFDLNVRNVLGTNGHIHKQVLRTLQEVGATGYENSTKKDTHMKGD
ncbi:inositol monophosphatase family protein [Numidum massiliense]|uniref:inositol monophosphatase family protein n=1 Tax=Numidum massiliense TaxID=1522315 RepID=UPI0006D52C48|nr:inositol monophosphatase family protein [Numidum massiliense]